MGNPLLLFYARPAQRRRQSGRRQQVGVPTHAPSTDAIFLALRRMRTPLMVLIGILSVSVFGLSFIPGVDEQGHPYRMSVFDAFYFMSYTAMTIGFGEVPHPFTTAQRMWVTASIYGTVIGWAYAIGALLALTQDQAFQEALAMQRFRRKVNAIRESFYIVVGYGQAGRKVCRELDEAGRRAVVIDTRRERIERVAGDEHYADTPALDADASVPGVLGLAGLGHPRLEGVLALTDDDTVNLAVVIAGDLLRPEVPVIARCSSQMMEERMHDFAPAAVINPSDRFGGYLMLALQRPTTYRLVSWLMASTGSALPAKPEHLQRGRWVVCADGAFGHEVQSDFHAAGMQCDLVGPDVGHPDLHGVAGFIAGTDNDTLNLALAEHARRADADIFVAVRQQTETNETLVKALGVDSVFTPTDLVATEALARVITPTFWSFVEHALVQDDEWSAQLFERMRRSCGNFTPERRLITIRRSEAPALTRWLRTRPLTLGELCTDPADRSQQLDVVVLVLTRDGTPTFVPGPDTELQRGDELLLAGRSTALDDLEQVLAYDSMLDYVATGNEVPTSWFWRLLTRRHLTSRR